MFNIQRFCVEDGPGIRTTVFLKGCPLRCLWCHNPESQLPGPQMSYDRERCIKCGACFDACAKHAIAKGSHFPDPKLCAGCDDCAQACPNGSRQIIGLEIVVGELMDTIVRDRGFYEESGGGVTFSGGEPLAQSSFLLEALRACRRLGIHTAVDTSGYAKRREALAVARLADLVLYDLKHVDDLRHRELTGVSNRPILDNLRALATEPVEVWIRVPLVPGVNDDPVHLELLGGFLASLEKHYPVWLLPYHRLGSHKLGRLGMPDRQEYEEPSTGRIERCADSLRAFGLEVCVNGKIAGEPPAPQMK